MHRLHYHGLKLGVFPLTKMFHDREQHSGKFHENSLRQKRIKTIRYSNPNNALTIDEDIRLQNSYRLRALAKLNFSRAAEIARIKKDLMELATLIKKPLELSKQKGPSFLL